VKRAAARGGARRLPDLECTIRFALTGAFSAAWPSVNQGLGSTNELAGGDGIDHLENFRVYRVSVEGSRDLVGGELLPIRVLGPVRQVRDERLARGNGPASLSGCHASAIRFGTAVSAFAGRLLSRGWMASTTPSR
jgi:hypothetical protein